MWIKISSQNSKVFFNNRFLALICNCSKQIDTLKPLAFSLNFLAWGDQKRRSTNIPLWPGKNSPQYNLISSNCKTKESAHIIAIEKLTAAT